jgi:tetratricopeptide (TPR) repeat protein
MAWGLVHFFELGAPDLSARFEAYLAAIQQPGRNPVVLFATTFEDVPLQERIVEYLRRGQFDHLESAPSAIAARVVTPQVRELPEDDANLHLAFLYAIVRTDQTRAQFGEHLALAKQSPRTRETAYLVSAVARLRDKDFAGAERELQEILRSSPDNAAFLEAHLDVLLARKASVSELEVAAQRLRPVATTAGQFCSLAEVAIHAGDRKAASELASRGLELDPRLVVCRNDLAAPLAPPHQP